MSTPALMFAEHGDPLSVLNLKTTDLPELGARDVRVQMLAAPVNPSDINILQGVYGDLPTLPAVGGKEGVGRVIAVGGDVTEHQPGTLVSADDEQGSWRGEVVIPAERVLPMPEGLSLAQAATLFINPCTAYRMLRDIVDLQPGDWVVQNGANSAVGRAVIEIAKHRGLRTINLVRRADERREALRQLGADVVLEDDRSARKEAAGAAHGAPIRLGLDCVGGESAGRLNRVLAQGGRHVVYGAMSKQGTVASAAALIFKDVAVQGYWISRWYQHASPAAVAEMWEDLAVLMRAGKLRPALDRVYRLEEHAAAIEHAMQPGRSGKVLFQCGDETVASGT